MYINSRLKSLINNCVLGYNWVLHLNKTALWHCDLKKKKNCKHLIFWQLFTIYINIVLNEKRDKWKQDSTNHLSQQLLGSCVRLGYISQSAEGFLGPVQPVFTIRLLKSYRTFRKTKTIQNKHKGYGKSVKFKKNNI